ncbi:uncharacterized protein LOC128727176 [Anopheles nili]|uniref:uncharacterized protein LOC128727176 n=1 Tax=Anopheles nili TaxID=185578 RepID=UPI00237B0624|nr:uncharacterized protein LOC128727176 [Anopheles nili]
MRASVVAFLFVLLAVSCHGTTTDREDIAASKDSSLATFLQPLEARLRDDQSLPERRSRELSYFGTGYGYNGYPGHYNPLYAQPYSQQGLYSAYGNPAYNGFGGLGGSGAYLGGGVGTLGGYGGYPNGQFGHGQFVGQGSGAYNPYGAGWNAIQSPYGGYGNQLGGYYSRGLYV